MKIRGGRNHIIFDMENGYILRAGGELQYSGEFWVHKDTIKNWEPPHENEAVTLEQYEDLVNQVNSRDPENSVPISFV